MSSLKKKGNLDFHFQNQSFFVSLKKLYFFDEDDNPVTVDYIINALKNLNVKSEANRDYLKFLIDYSHDRDVLLEEVILLSEPIPLRKGSEVLQLPHNIDVSTDDIPYWEMLNQFFLYLDVEALHNLPRPALFFNKGDIIAYKKIMTEQRNSTNLFGEEKIASRLDARFYETGENVSFDQVKGTYIAGECGYLTISSNKLSIKSPFIFTKDKMKLYFINLQRFNDKLPKTSEIEGLSVKYQINKIFFIYGALKKIKSMEHLLLAQGKKPGDSLDASLEIKFKTEEKIGTMDEKGVIDYKEKNSIESVNEGQLLAVKLLPQKGEDGADLFGNVIPSRNPKDVILKTGIGTKKNTTETKMEVYSDTDGVVEYKHDILSVFPTVAIRGDIDYEYGNINTDANVEISGSVRAGFKVISKKNIHINGTIEDNCLIEAEGSIYVKEGIIGEKIKINSGGDLTSKFIEGAVICARGNIKVERFILNSNITCCGDIVVYGKGINMNEKGAVIDSTIRVRQKLFVPTVGSDVGLKVVFQFAYDEALERKLEQLTKTCDALKIEINELREKFEVDITSPNIHILMKDFTREVKDKIISAVQEKNKIENKLKMIEGIMNKEVSNKKELLENSSIEISRKVFPPVILQCNKLQKTVDEEFGPSKFYYDFDRKGIERSPFVQEKV